MSAWIVSTEHINLIVTAAVGFDLIKESAAQELADEMTMSNYASVNYRYDDNDTPVTSVYKEVQPDTNSLRDNSKEDLVYAVFMFKQVRCYAYQSSEHPKWNNSFSKEICDLIEDRLVDMAEMDIGDILDSETYNDSPWGI